MTQRLPVNKTVLVLGDTPEARRVAGGLEGLGYLVLWVVGANSDADMANRLWIYKGQRFEGLDGHVGRFRAHLSDGSVHSILSCAAVVVATGSERYWPAKRYSLPLGGAVLSVPQMAARMNERPSAAQRRRQRIALLLDWGGETPRETAAETLELAIRLRSTWHCEVVCFYQNLKVDSYNVERLTREMRDCGVLFSRYDALQVTASDAGVELAYVEGTLSANLLVLPEAVRPAADTARLARALRVHVGADGYFQDVNIHHYRPGLASRQGVFFCGRCHMDADAQQVATDVAQTLANVDALLGSGALESEKVVARVDADKCIRCLTCVRTCPHAAAEIVEYYDTGEADTVTASYVDVWACRGCGACAANCPVKAIEMVDASEAQPRGVPEGVAERPMPSQG